MEIVFGQVLTLVIFAAAGYILAKCKILNPAQASILSSFLVYVSLPCKTFLTFASNLTVSYISSHSISLLISLAVLVALALIALVPAKFLGKTPYERKVFHYSLVIPNYGYFGYPMAEGLFGSVVLLDVMVFAMPLTIYCYTVGYCTLSGKKFSPMRLLNPTTIALALGCVVGLCTLPIPDVINGILTSGGNCMGPVSMVLLGITLSEMPFHSLLTDWRAYLVTALRLVVIPVLIYFCLRPFASQDVLLCALLVYCMPCGLNTIVFPKLTGESCAIGSELAFLSNILSLVAIPLVLKLIV